MTTVEEVRAAAQIAIRGIKQGFKIDNDAYQIPNIDIETHVTDNVNARLTHHTSQFDEGGLDEGDVEAVADDVRDTAVETLGEPSEFAMQTSKPAEAVRLLADNYSAVSNAYDAHGGGDAGSLDEQMMSAVNAWYLECATKVVRYWNEQLDDLYDAIMDEFN